MKGFFSAETVTRKRDESGLLPQCGSCGLFKSCTSPKIPVQGNGARGILIVGESPGASGDASGFHFSGETGKYLKNMLESLDLKMSRDTWQTNALICKLPKGKNAESKQVSFCRPNLLNAIKENEPRVIIPMGAHALSSVIQDSWKGSIDGIDRWTGWQIPLAKHWVCPVQHPLDLIKAKNTLLDNQFRDQLEAAFDIQGLPPKQPNYLEHIEVLYDDYEVCKALEEMDDLGGWVAVDYETNCLKPEYEDARAVSCAVSNGIRTISFPWIGKSKEAMGKFLKSKRTRKIASNLKMEERWTRKMFRHGVRNWGWDTMLAAHCLDNRPGICSLKFQSFVQMGVPTYNETVEPFLKSPKDNHYNRVKMIDTRTLLVYGGMDAILEYMMAMLQRKAMGFED